MAEPTPYTRSYSFSDYQANNPSQPLPGPQVDNELENIEQSLGEAIDAVNDVRRADGALVNGIVTIDSLDDTVKAGVGAGALASAEAAAQSAIAASESAGAAAGSAGAASSSAGAASTSAGQAQGFRNEASSFRDLADSARTGAQTARDFASQWASAPENTTVDDGVNDPNYSAYHWAQVALGAAEGNLPDGSVTETKLASGVTDKLNGALQSGNDLSDVSSPVLAAGNLDLIKRNTITALLADDVLAYSAATGKTVVSADQIVDGGGYRYSVAASAATDHDVTTAGGVKLYVLPDSIGAIYPQQFGAVGDGTYAGTGTDGTVAVQKWGLSTRSKLKVLTACFLVSAAVQINIGDTVQAIGDGGLDGSAITSMGTAPALLYADGSANLVQLTTLSADRSAGSLTTPLTDASGLEVGDFYCLYNPTDYSWIGVGGGRDSYREGEWLQVANISGNNVTPYRSLYYGYAAADIQVWRLRGGGTQIRGGRYKPPYLETAAIQIDCDVNPVVKDLRSDGSDNAGVRLVRCMNIDVDLRTFQREDTNNTPSNEYALHVGACHGGEVHGSFHSQRHGLSFGNADYACCVPNRDITIYVNTHSPMNQSLDVGGHGCSDRLTVVGGQHSGLVTGGGNMTFIGCTFERGTTEDAVNPGLCVYAAEIRGGDHRYIGCTFKSLADATNGFIQYQLSAGVKEKLRIFFDNCNFLNQGSNYCAMRILVNGGTFPVEVYVNGGLVDAGASMTQFVRMQRLSGADTSKAFVEGIKGLVLVPPITDAGTGWTLSTYVDVPPIAHAVSDAGASISAGGSRAIVVTGFSNLSYGDSADYGVSGALGANFQVSARITGTTQVTIYVSNVSSGSLTLAALTWTAYVKKRS